MEHNKATFRATRERIGLSQKDLANLLGCSAETIKQWERPSGNEPSDRAWAFMEDALAEHENAVHTSVDVVRRQIEDAGYKPTHVNLLVYRSQHDYDMYGRDEGVFSMVNARARDVAAILADMGIPAVFLYPGDNEMVFQQLAKTRG